MIRVVKTGGALIEDDQRLEVLCDSIARLPQPVVVVHGGGKMAARMAGELGVEVRMHNGRRLTDAPTLQIAVMVYAGLANKRLVASLGRRGVKAFGLSGCDMMSVVAHKRLPTDGIDWGYVGDIDTVNCDALSMLLERGITPVVAPITCSNEGQLLNTNADSVASAVSASLAQHFRVETTFCLDKAGVLADVDNPDSVIDRIDRELYASMVAEGTVFEGMIPKLDNAFALLNSGIDTVRLTDANHLEGGTVICRKR